ncbi:LamG domain-containing protein [Winogradskyella forsetii]|uniref:LamG domain-containing protein n=1 Tax=Winogradskyella forsetii TaxID=2686077 RepID=UPI0015B85E34|nr:LamG domain-containing protein [Winogradskyella forsetii]
MKTINKYIFGLIALLMLASCYDGIDPITEVDPGPDMAVPIVEIIQPNNDIIIPFTDTQTDLDIMIRVQDDIEIDNVTLIIDGNTFASFDSFLDYRMFIETFEFENMQLGTHTIELIANDLAGNSVSDNITFEVDNTYTPMLESETLYIPFYEGIYTDLISETDPEVVGNPEIVSGGYLGQAYQGATDSYLTFPTSGLLGDEFSATFWYKLNDDPNRAGILVISPPDEANPDAPNNRNSGFRFFREARAGKQSFRLNVGNGTAGVTAIPDASSDLENSSGWVHYALTISQTNARIYLDGELIADQAISGLDWTGCDIMSIMSGEPRFIGWNHRSDLSLMDELRLYNEVLTQAEIQSML